MTRKLSKIFQDQGPVRRPSRWTVGLTSSDYPNKHVGVRPTSSCLRSDLVEFIFSPIVTVYIRSHPSGSTNLGPWERGERQRVKMKRDGREPEDGSTGKGILTLYRTPGEKFRNVRKPQEVGFLFSTTFNFDGGSTVKIEQSNRFKVSNYCEK